MELKCRPKVRPWHLFTPWILLCCTKSQLPWRSAMSLYAAHIRTQNTCRTISSRCNWEQRTWWSDDVTSWWRCVRRWRSPSWLCSAGGTGRDNGSWAAELPGSRPQTASPAAGRWQVPRHKYNEPSSSTLNPRTTQVTQPHFTSKVPVLWVCECDYVKNKVKC